MSGAFRDPKVDLVLDNRPTGKKFLSLFLVNFFPVPFLTT